MSDLANRPLKTGGVDPDQFTSGALPDNFDGTIAGAGYTVWNYDKKGKNAAGHYFFMAYVDIQPGPSTGYEPFRQHYTAGGGFKDKNTGEYHMTWFPSKDGKTPAGASVDDYQALANAKVEIEPGTEDQFSGPYCVGFGDSIDKGSNWADFLTKLHLAGHPKGNSADPRADFMVGARCHFNRMDPPARGDGFEGGGKILVVTQVHSVGNGQAPAQVQAQAALTPTATPAPVQTPAQAAPVAAAAPQAAPTAPVAATPTQTAGGGNLEQNVEQAIFELITAAGGSMVLDGTNLPKVVQTLQSKFGPQSPGFVNNPENVKAFADIVSKVLGQDKSWLAGRSMFKFDLASNTFSL